MIQAALSLVLLAGLAGGVDDAAIRDNVLERLRSSVLVSGFSFDASVREGRVKLTGRVDTLAERDEAASVVARTAGVLAFEDGVVLSGRGRGDATIDGDIRRAFEDRPRLAGAGLTWSVKSGKVSLSGSVPDAQVKLDAAATCATIRGVVEIEDLIRTPERSDDVILAATGDFFGPLATRRIAGEIEASVAAGVVTLQGRVPRLWDAWEAKRAVNGIEGVRGIVDQLRVDPRPQAVRVVDP